MSIVCLILTTLIANDRLELVDNLLCGREVVLWIVSLLSTY